jgi:hypothetical protein
MAATLGLPQPFAVLAPRHQDGIGRRTTTSSSRPDGATICLFGSGLEAGINKPADLRVAFSSSSPADIGAHRNGCELLSNEKPIPRVGHNDPATKQGCFGHSANRLLKCRTPTKQR